MSSALSVLTIPEAPDGVATGYCGRLFAAHGATVLQIWPPNAAGLVYGGAGSEPVGRWLDAGKRRIGDDPAHARSQASKDVDLILTRQYPHAVTVMDAVLESTGLADATRLGLTSLPRQGAYRHWTRSNAVVKATLGEHKESVLAGDLGLSVEEFAALSEHGVIGNRAVLNA
ncbi:hypothetical protein IF803_39765 [Bradyrhizobium sp. UFLA06-06]